MDEQTPPPEGVLVEVTPPKKPGFWKYNFSGPPTKGQIIFDVIVGVVLPLGLVIFDPVVFVGGGIVAGYSLFSYLAIGLGALALITWLAAGQRITGWAGLFAGALLVGGLFAVIIGIAMAPFAVLGLFFLCIGALGFIPFLTAFVYFRNGMRALKLARSRQTGGVRVAAMMLVGVLIVLGLPYLAHRLTTDRINRDVDLIATTQNEADIAMAVDDLRKTNQLCLKLCTRDINTVFLRWAGGQFTGPDWQRIMSVQGQVIPGAPTTSPLSLLTGTGAND